MIQVSKENLLSAQSKMRSVNYASAKCLADDFRKLQPNLYSEIVELGWMNISRERVQFVFDILLTCFLSIKESGNNFSYVHQNNINKETHRFLEIVKIENWLDHLSIETVLNQTLGRNSGKVLSEFAYTELILFHYNIIAAENDKYVVMLATVLVNCIESAFSEHNKHLDIDAAKGRGSS